MLALSILQPYAWLIASGHKDIENRTWATRFRGRFLIHAGKSYNLKRYLEDKALYASQYGIALPAFADLRTGGIVGRATLTDCVREHSSRWKHRDAFGYVLADAAHLGFIQMPGMLKFFGVPGDLIEKEELAGTDVVAATGVSDSSR